MGWSYGHNLKGREIGYGVEATCDHPGCEERIDRGVAYACGGGHDADEESCAGYFCPDHLFFHNGPSATTVCVECLMALRREHAKRRGATIEPNTTKGGE